eukprot:CAMPEP_0114252506 /NCGR_PEP_ID=MMETSP0058-20121206/15874_1 /TAXON_ID=36894 /ORGANISM="Pyramimonas parkeae, CCMP726" /LENGTH=335 /DNA_ID=CAMNT_0001366447 /DNA_START=59 /DNA_END=1066 /DNA_ORIENTATION=+
MASSSAFMSSRMSFAGSRVSVASAPRRGPMRARMTARSALEVGTASLQGTSRTQNEDRFAYKTGTNADVSLFVFDGHGGYATAEWLAQNIDSFISKRWGRDVPERAVRKAFISADKELLEAKGFMGMGERGLGGSKCGSTAAAAFVYKEDGTTKLMAANCGDSRVIMCKDGQPPLQLTVDHVPDQESERVRIENQNPNPKMPLVQFVGGTWRVGGLLALSRAFGDAYMKASGFNEGIADLGNDYSSGFGVIADPEVTTVDLEGKGWLIICSDGLNTNEERGGGGGLENDEVAKICQEAGSSMSSDDLAKKLCEAAAKSGSSDDITVIAVRLENLL